MEKKSKYSFDFCTKRIVAWSWLAFYYMGVAPWLLCGSIRATFSCCKKNKSRKRSQSSNDFISYIICMDFFSCIFFTKRSRHNYPNCTHIKFIFQPYGLEAKFFISNRQFFNCICHRMYLIHVLYRKNHKSIAYQYE